MKMRNYWVSLALLITVVGCAVANDYYTHGSFPSPGSPATSAAMRAELDLIAAGFDKLPTFSGNASKAVIINGSANALSTTTGTLTLAGNFAISGAYATTLTVTGATGVTLPTTGTLATLAGAETLTNKTLNLTSNTLTGTKAQFNTAMSDADFATLAGTETLTNKTLTSPVLTTPSFSGNASTNFGISTASAPRLTLNSTSGSDRRSIISFDQSGSSKFGLILDQSLADAQEFTIYDFENARAVLSTLIDGTVFVPIALRMGGLLDLSSAVGAGQIAFPSTQNPSSDANTLDDYEEGVFSPSLGGNTTYTVQVGKYVKIGKQVTVSVQLIVNVKGTGSSVMISGLPFNVDGAASSGVDFANAAGSYVSMTATTCNTSDVCFATMTAAGASASLGNAVFQNGTQTYFSLTYLAS